MRFLVARRDGEPVGTGAIWLRELAFAEVKRIYVRPAARGLKLGRLILRRLEEEARGLGYPLLRLETGTLQPEALGLFASEGFSPCAAFADYPPDDPFSLFFEKRIA
jgi:putative acetyltransferase